MTNQEKIDRINELVSAGVLTQEEADAKIKPLEDKIAADKAAAEEAERKAKEDEEKAAGERSAKIEDIKKQIADSEGKDELERYFEVLVPSEGKADTVAGELVRAMMKILYRDWNDGDKFYEGYGLETCGQAAAFLAENTNSEIEEKLGEICEEGFDGDEYTRGIEEVSNMLINYLEENEELLVTPNEEDMYDYSSDGWEEMAPTYEIDIEIPENVQAYLDAKIISERDLVDEVDWWEWNGKTRKEEFEVTWSNELHIEELSREGYDDWESNGYDWLEDFGRQLADQYGAPDYVPEIELDKWQEALDIITGNGKELGDLYIAATAAKAWLEDDEIARDTIEEIHSDGKPINDENYLANITDFLSEDFIHNYEDYRDDFKAITGGTDEEFENLVRVCGGEIDAPVAALDQDELDKQEPKEDGEPVAAAVDQKESLETSAVKESLTESVESDYREFVKVLKDRDINFHPDDDFKDYINVETKEPVFSEEEAKDLNAKMDNFAQKLGDKIYDIAMEVYGINLGEYKKESIKEEVGSEEKEPVLEKHHFSPDGEHSYEGYDTRLVWNGFSVPAFTKEVGLKIAEEINAAQPDVEVVYDEAKDVFITKDHSWEDVEGYRPEEASKVEFDTVDGKLSLYCIGGYEWAWVDLDSEAPADEKPIGNFEQEIPVDDTEMIGEFSRGN